MMSFVEPARRAYGYGEYLCTVTAGNATELFRRDSVSSADETIKTIAAFRRIDVSVRQDRYSLCGVIRGRIEVREVVCLRVNWLSKLPAYAELETQPAAHLPTIRDECFRLR